MNWITVFFSIAVISCKYKKNPSLVFISNKHHFGLIWTIEGSHNVWQTDASVCSLITVKVYFYLFFLLQASQRSYVGGV